MAVKNTNTKGKNKVNPKNNTNNKNIRKKIVEKVREKVNKKFLLLITLFSGILLIFSTYAWLSASLNVKVKFLNLVVSSDSGLFISLDGKNFGESIVISNDTVINDLRNIYRNNTNQWASGGLWPVSSNGIKNGNRDKFDIYVGTLSKVKDRSKTRFLNTRLATETFSSSSNAYIAFDMFLKNVSGSPYSDNLYISGDTYVDFEQRDDTDEELGKSMNGLLNSIRFGVLKTTTVSSKSDLNIIQNIPCNNKCDFIIFEPNSTSHSETSIERAKEYGIELIDGVYTPTYAVINSGERLGHLSGQVGTGMNLDTEHFALQKTITDFEKPIFEIPNGITKFRVYIWIEGQDVDSLETNSEGADIYIALNFVKDLSGYNE